NSSSIGREKADDYLIFDMLLSYHINANWNVNVNGDNLTDESYEEQLGGGHFIPGAGRAFSLSTTYSF
ncbi:MAG: TonB-dependent receptor, partial [Gammaproteobacteria bacterium]